MSFSWKSNFPEFCHVRTNQISPETALVTLFVLDNPHLSSVFMEGTRLASSRVGSRGILRGVGMGGHGTSSDCVLDAVVIAKAPSCPPVLLYYPGDIIRSLHLSWADYVVSGPSLRTVWCRGLNIPLDVGSTVVVMTSETSDIDDCYLTLQIEDL